MCEQFERLYRHLGQVERAFLDGTLPQDRRKAGPLSVQIMQDRRDCTRGSSDARLNRMVIDATKAAINLLGLAPKSNKPLQRTYSAQKIAEGLGRLRDAMEVLAGAWERPSHEPAEPRLKVDLAKMTIVLDGKTYDDIRSLQALRWIRILAENAGAWITAAKLKKYDAELDGVRTDRLISFLPKDISNLIQARPGMGSRLVLA